MASQPNVLVITCHDLGRQLGCYGADVETPAIDRLAAAGARFERSFAAAPQCSPSRGAMSTGRYPHRNGLMGLVHRGWDLDPDERTMPAYCADAGYETYLFGLQHEATDPARLGYEHVHDESRAAPAVSTAFADAVETLEPPWFAGVGFFETHRPFGNDVHEPPDPATIDLPGFLPDEPGIREDLAEMIADVRLVDDAVDRILGALEAAGRAEDTLVLFAADHGIAFPRAKSTCLDGGIEIPLLARHPGLVEPDTTVEQLVSNVDVLPTILELIGEPIPEDLDGRSFRPALEGDQTDPRSHVFAEQTWHVRPSPTRAVRTDRYKYIQNYMTHLPRAGKEDRRDPEEELYDLRADPHERSNLLSDEPFTRRGQEPPAVDLEPTVEEVYRSLRHRLQEWMRRTEDPIAAGVLPLSNHDRDRFAG